jgi:hypothetical protein
MAAKPVEVLPPDSHHLQSGDNAKKHVLKEEFNAFDFSFVFQLPITSFSGESAIPAKLQPKLEKRGLTAIKGGYCYQVLANQESASFIKSVYRSNPSPKYRTLSGKASHRRGTSPRHCESLAISPVKLSKASPPPSNWEDGALSKATSIWHTFPVDHSPDRRTQSALSQAQDSDAKPQLRLKPVSVPTVTLTDSPPLTVDENGTEDMIGTAFYKEAISIRSSLSLRHSSTDSYGTRACSPSITPRFHHSVDASDDEDAGNLAAITLSPLIALDPNEHIKDTGNMHHWLANLDKITIDTQSDSHVQASHNCMLQSPSSRQQLRAASGGATNPNQLPASKLLVTPSGQYEVLCNEVLGEGAFSIIYACKHKAAAITHTSADTEDTVAIKIPKIVPENTQAQTTLLRELGMLRHLEKAISTHQATAAEASQGGIKYIISLLGALSFANILHLVFPRIAGGHLGQILQVAEYQQGIPLEIVTAIMSQLLQALAFLHDIAQIIHADIKLDNILLKQPLSEMRSVEIVLIDLGNSFFIHEAEALNTGGEKASQYCYLQSRFYRAPEVINGLFYGEKLINLFDKF